MTSYTVLYDVSQTAFTAWHEVVPWIVAALVGVGARRFRSEPSIRRVGLFMTWFGILMLIASLGVNYANHERLLSRLRSGVYDHVEGIITEFSPGLTNGHREERFVVAGHTYTYWAGVVTAGFRDVQGEDGPLQVGTQVRIADVDGKIARLEIVLNPPRQTTTGSGTPPLAAKLSSRLRTNGSTRSVGTTMTWIHSRRGSVVVLWRDHPDRVNIVTRTADGPPPRYDMAR